MFKYFILLCFIFNLGSYVFSVETNTRYYNNGSAPNDNIDKDQKFETFAEAYRKVKIDARTEGSYYKRLPKINEDIGSNYPIEYYKSSNNGALVAITLHPPHIGFGGDIGKYWHFHAKKVELNAFDHITYDQQGHEAISRTKSFSNCSGHYFIENQYSYENIPKNSIFQPELIETVRQRSIR